MCDKMDGGKKSILNVERKFVLSRQVAINMKNMRQYSKLKLFIHSLIHSTFIEHLLLPHSVLGGQDTAVNKTLKSLSSWNDILVKGKRQKY